jgi:hypothetical protein
MGPIFVAGTEYCASHASEQRCIDFAHNVATMDRILPWVLGVEIAVAFVIVITALVRR